MFVFEPPSTIEPTTIELGFDKKGERERKEKERRRTKKFGKSDLTFTQK